MVLSLVYGIGCARCACCIRWVLWLLVTPNFHRFAPNETSIYKLRPCNLSSIWDISFNKWHMKKSESWYYSVVEKYIYWVVTLRSDIHSDPKTTTIERWLWELAIIIIWVVQSFSRSSPQSVCVDNAFTLCLKRQFFPQDCILILLSKCSMWNGGSMLTRSMMEATFITFLWFYFNCFVIVEVRLAEMSLPYCRSCQLSSS